MYFYLYFKHHDYGFCLSASQSLVCHEMITNTSCYHVGRCLLGPLSHTAYEKGECDDLSISRTQMGHFALSNCEPCLQTRVNIYPSVHPDPWMEA